jgi:hypothetical protein
LEPHGFSDVLFSIEPGVTIKRLIFTLARRLARLKQAEQGLFRMRKSGESPREQGIIKLFMETVSGFVHVFTDSTEHREKIVFFVIPSDELQDCELIIGDLVETFPFCQSVGN